MKKTIIFSTIIFLLLGLVISLFVLLLRENDNHNEITLYGNVDVRQVDIGFRVNGQVSNLLFEEGDKVSQGALMCALDSAPYDSLLKEAKSNEKAIQVNLENAKILLQRRKELIGSGAISQEELDDAQSTRDQLYANLLQAKANVAVAKDNLEFTKAYAPTDGIILTRIREPGTIVNPADPVYTLSVSSPIWIRAFVDEPLLGVVHYGMKAEVITDIIGAHSYIGTVGFISPVAEFTPKTVETTKLRTDLVYRLRIYVDNPDHQLVQGMPVTVKLKMKSR